MIEQTMHGMKGLVGDGVSRSSDGRKHARGWFRDPALWAWIVVGLLALLPLPSTLAQLLT